MTAGVQAAANPCCNNILIHAWQECGYNFRDAVMGNKINLVAQNALPDPAAAPAPNQDFGLGRRVSAFAIGCLLFVPVINMLVLSILRHNNSDFVHIKPVTSQTTNLEVTPEPAPQQVVVNPNPVQVVVNRNPPQPAPEPNLPPHIHPVLAPNTPEMRQRKERAAERLDEIEAMAVAAGNPDHFATLVNEHFQCHPRLTQFDLDVFLNERYATDAHPRGLMEFRDWARVQNDGTWRNNDENLQRVWGAQALRPNNIDTYGAALTRHNYENRRREWFEYKLNQYSGDINIRGYRTVRDRLQNILAYFTVERARVDAERAHVAEGTPEEVALNEKEDALKERFRTFHNRFIDASHDCVDQVISQVETCALDIAIQGNRSEQIPLQQRLINQACLALYNRRRELITVILQEQDRERANAIVAAVLNRNDNQALQLAREAGFNENDGISEADVRIMIAQVRQMPEQPRPGETAEQARGRVLAERLRIFSGRHMADWQRLAIGQLAQALGLGEHNRDHLGAAHNGELGLVRVHLALEAFRLQYHPEDYLLRGLARVENINDPEGDLRAAANGFILQWAIELYALGAENPNAPNPNEPQLDERLAPEGPIMPGATQGGYLTASATVLLMEAAGLMIPRNRG